MNAAEKTVLNIVYQHRLACERIEEWIRNSTDHVSTTRPALQITLTTKKAAGFYCHRIHSCIYPLAYAIVGGSAYRQTVYHEVVHGYQWQIWPKCETHGEFFKFLMFHAMGIKKGDRFHRYNIKHAKAMSKLLQIQFTKQEIKEMQERCINETQRIDRKAGHSPAG